MTIMLCHCHVLIVEGIVFTILGNGQTTNEQYIIMYSIRQKQSPLLAIDYHYNKIKRVICILLFYKYFDGQTV